MQHATPPQGRLLGDFRIVREIGRGGMGVVYEAVHGTSGRRVALKVLEAHLTLQKNAVDRFLREAHAAAALEHEHIVPVEHVGEVDGVHFFAMELVDGASLADVIVELATRSNGGASGAAATPAPAEIVAPYREQPFTTAARTVGAIARALHHAHERGVLHRDVKPSNILLRRDGTPRLIDFGLAREDGLPALTQTGDLVGSPYYVAPEQCSGGHAVLDRRVDVYALGVVLYELITLRRPFEGVSAHDVLERIETGESVAPRELRPELPRDLDTVVRRAMAPAPEDRYATAADLARDLERFLAGRPIHARPARAGAWRRALFSRLRSRNAVMTAAAALVIAGVAFLGSHLDPRELIAAARASARLTIETEQAGVIAEVFAGPLATGRPVQTVTLPQQSALRLAPGLHALRVRAPGHDARVLEGERALALSADEAAVVSVWLAPVAELWSRELAMVPTSATSPVVVDFEGDGRDELVVAKRGGELVVLDGEGATRPFAKLEAEPDLLAAERRVRDGAAQVVAAATIGLASVVRGFDSRGAVVLERTVRGRVVALVPVPGSGSWLAATDLGHVVELRSGSQDAESESIRADLGVPAFGLATAGAGTGKGVPRVAALTRGGLRLLGDGGRGDEVPGGSGPFASGVRLLAMQGPSTSVLAVVDATETRFFAPDERDKEHRWRRTGARSADVRQAVVLPGSDANGDWLALTDRDGRLRVLAADATELAAIDVGESEALALARGPGDSATLVVATRRSVLGCMIQGRQGHQGRQGRDLSRRFEVTTEGRVGGLVAMDADGDGVDEVAVRLEGDRVMLLGSEPEVRWKAAADVLSFVVLPEQSLGPVRIAAQERGGRIVAFAADGRRVAEVRSPEPSSALVADAAERANGAKTNVWFGGADGSLQLLSWSGPGLAVAAAAQPGTHAVTGLASGPLGASGGARLVTGDAGGGITCRLTDGHAETRFTPRAGASVRHLVVGRWGSAGRVQAIAALTGGVLLRFDVGMKPCPPSELGRECSALALADLDGDGANELLVALEGGEIARFDAAEGGSIVLPHTATALASFGSADSPGAGAIAGTANGQLYRLDGTGAAPHPIAQLSGPVLEVTASRSGSNGVFVAAATSGRVLALRPDGSVGADVAARGGAGRLALEDLDGDEAPEVVYVDDRGRLVVRELNAPRR